RGRCPRSRGRSRARGPGPAPPPARRGAARPPALLLRPSCLVQLGVDRARGLRRERGHALELLLRGGEEALRRAEVIEDRAAPRRADPLEPVEDRAERAG